MPTTRQYLRRPHRAALNATQEMELWLGPSHHGTAFASDEHRRAAWFRHRDKLMRLWGKDGHRPQAWWWYEAPEGLWYPGHDHERSILYTAGVLSEEERAYLEAQWRKEFDRTWDPHFSHIAEPGKIFTGEAARERHCLWADVPPDLYEEWTAERQRCAEVIGKLEEESQATARSAG
jgi:hypothetical protein